MMILEIHKINKTKYRNELNGIRAIAIVSVIFYHFNKDIVPNGYLGVDIFFLLSGYVITLSTYKRNNLNFKKFIFDFYKRRIKKLLPIFLIFTISVSLITFFFVDDNYLSIKTSLTSLLGISNIYLWKNSTNYFGAASELNPFLHTWSLSIEMQFYIIFPFLLLFSNLKNRIEFSKRIINLILVLTVFSLLGFVYFFDNNQSLAYFLFPLRFWELGIGILTFVFSKKLKDNKFIKFIDPKFSFLLIVVILFLPYSFAPLANLFIIILTSFLIINIDKKNSLYSVLSNNFITKVGILSYPLYLWHWAIISLSKSTIGINLWTLPFQIFIIYYLSFFSNTLIQDSVLKNKSIWKSFIFFIRFFYLTIISILIIYQGLILRNKYINNSIYLTNSNLKNKNQINSYKEICALNEIEKKSLFISEIFKNCFLVYKNNKSTIWSVGDSHNYNMNNGIRYAAENLNYNLFSFSINGASFPAIKYFRIDKKDRFIKGFEIMKLIQTNLLEQAQKGDIIIINIRYQYHFGNIDYQYPINKFRYFSTEDKILKVNSKKSHFQNWLNELNIFSKEANKKGIKIIISTPKPEFKDAYLKLCKGQNDKWFNKYSRKKCILEKDFFVGDDGIYKNFMSEINILSTQNNNLFKFDTLSILCSNNKCSYSDKKNILYKDDNHISEYASKNIIGPEVLLFIEEKILKINN